MLTSAWAQQLQPASYNDIPFIVETSSYSTGRRVAVHEYPYRDNPWVEDLGLNRRMVQFTGFLAGDDCYDQRDQLKAACETPGDGVLVHPSIGTLNASLIAAGFSERAERGRSVGINLQFIVTDDTPRWPANDIDSQTWTDGSADDLDGATDDSFVENMGNAGVENATFDDPGSYTASDESFMDQVGDTLKSAKATVREGVSEVQGAIKTARGYVNQCLQPLRDASRLVHSVDGLTSIISPKLSLGRYISGGSSSLSGSLNSVLAPISRDLSTINRVSSGMSAITSNLSRLDSSATRAFHNVSDLADRL